MRFTRITAALVAGVLGGALFATGVWAGSARDDGSPSGPVQAESSSWRFDPQTGNPTGPEGQPDFWNYDPATGEKISDYSPGVAPEDLAMGWSISR